MSIRTVTGLIAQARVLLLDTIVPYRYSDAELLEALNTSLLEARRLRPDLFIGTVDGTTIPEYVTVDATAIAIDIMFLNAILYFVVGHAQLRDEEETTDSRVSAFFKSFRAKLTQADG